MSKQPWALVLGASSGFGAATSLELAKAGMNVFGVHLDRRDKLPGVDELQAKIRETGREAVFWNVNASDDQYRTETVEKMRARLSGEPRGTLRVLLHSLAFGSLKPLVGAEQTVSKKPLARVLGTGLPARGAVRRRRADLRHDVGGWHARDSELRRGERGQGVAGGAHPTVGGGARAGGDYGERDHGGGDGYAGAPPDPGPREDSRSGEEAEPARQADDAGGRRALHRRALPSADVLADGERPECRRGRGRGGVRVQ
jgi:hypothetical protein